MVHNKLEQKQSLKQALKINQHLGFSLEILTLPMQNLELLLKKEEEENPLLIVAENEDNVNVLEEMPKKPKTDSTYFGDSDFDYISNIPARPNTFIEFLMDEIESMDFSNEDLLIAKNFVYFLDEQGFLRENIRSLAKKLNVPEKRIANIIERLKTLEPRGVFTHNLVECLLMQTDDPVLSQMIKEDLNKVADKRYGYLREKYHLSREALETYLKKLKQLNPIPSKGFDTSYITRFVIPDLEIKKIGEDYVVTINKRYEPQLSIDEYYKGILKNGDETDKEFMKDKLKRAKELIEAFGDRINTLYAVGEAIVELQRDFLDKGILYLKPMTLEDVANHIGHAISTVSRAINEKYVSTPRGIYPLKYFFSAGVRKGKGDRVSRISVKKLIEEIVNKEDKNHPYSDEKLRDILKDRGISISRRGVTKYRRELNIPSSSKRKK